MSSHESWSEYAKYYVDFQLYEQTLSRFLEYEGNDKQELIDLQLLKITRKKKKKKNGRNSNKRIRTEYQLQDVERSTVHTIRGVVQRVLDNAANDQDLYVFQRCLKIANRLEDFSLLRVLGTQPSALVFSIMQKHSRTDKFVDMCFHEINSKSSSSRPGYLKDIYSFLEYTVEIRARNLLWMYKKHLYDNDPNGLSNLFLWVHQNERANTTSESKLLTILFESGQVFSKIDKLSVLFIGLQGQVVLPIELKQLLTHLSFTELVEILLNVLNFCSWDSCPVCQMFQLIFADDAYITSANVLEFIKAFHAHSQIRDSAKCLESKTFELSLGNISQANMQGKISTELILKVFQFVGLSKLESLITKKIDKYTREFNNKNISRKQDELESILCFCDTICHMYEKNNETTALLTDFFIKVQRFQKSAITFNIKPDLQQIVFDDLLNIKLPQHVLHVETSEKVLCNFSNIQVPERLLGKRPPKIIQVYPLHTCVISNLVELAEYSDVSFKVSFFQYKILDLFNGTDTVEYIIVRRLASDHWQKLLNSSLRKLIKARLVKPYVDKKGVNHLSINLTGSDLALRLSSSLVEENGGRIIDLSI